MQGVGGSRPDCDIMSRVALVDPRVYGRTDLIRIGYRSLPSIGSVWIRGQNDPDKESKLRICISGSLYAFPEVWIYLNSSFRKNILPFFPLLNNRNILLYFNFFKFLVIKGRPVTSYYGSGTGSDF